MKKDKELTIKVITKEEYDKEVREQQLRIDRAVSRIVLHHTFFASMLLSLKREPVDWAPTMCTDGVHIYWNPFFAKSCSPEELQGVLVHEVLHPALGHLWRTAKSWDKQIANMAADYAINNFLDIYNQDAPNGRKLLLPEGGLIDHKYDGMAFEHIYAQLVREARKKGGGGGGKGQPGGGGKSGGMGDPGDYVSEGEFMEPGQIPGKKDKEKDGGNGGGTGANDTVTESDWANRMEAARQASRAMGNMPAGLDRMLGALHEPEVNWLEQMSRFMDQVRQDDYDWQVPDRRFLESGFYIPGLHNEACGPVAVIFDTSGSVDDALIQRFAGELQDIMNRVRPSKVVVIYCDAAVANVEEFRPGDVLTLHPKGGGGTDFRPALNKVATDYPDTEVAVYFTDGYGSFPSCPPDFPIMWVDYGGGVNYPFGEVVKVTL